MADSINKITVNNVSYDLQPNVATSAAAGIVKPDNASILVSEDGIISSNITASTTDIGEGATLATGALYFVYEE